MMAGSSDCPPVVFLPVPPATLAVLPCARIPWLVAVVRGKSPLARRARSAHLLQGRVSQGLRIRLQARHDCSGETVEIIQMPGGDGEDDLPVDGVVGVYRDVPEPDRLFHLQRQMGVDDFGLRQTIENLSMVLGGGSARSDMR